MNAPGLVSNFVSRHLEFVIILGLGLFASFQVFRHKRKQNFARQVLKKAIESNLGEPISLHPEVDPRKCTGCAVCTRVCPEGDILQMINNRAVLVSPTKCVGHGQCERSCPTGAITLVFGTKTRGVDIPRIDTHYQTNVPGVYIAGELGGMGLIKNAVKQGVLSATHALESLPAKRTADYDLFVVGAGPAGLAASLMAIAKKKKYMTIDQNTFGGTVYNFPRQKIVMTQPADLPLVGKMEFRKNKVSKEDLLSYWSEVRRKAGIRIHEKTKFETLENLGTHFLIKTSQGNFTASKVILAMGVGGSPRKLGLPNEDLPKVTYSLLDPSQYQGKNLCVVGGGNSAVEAAQMLSRSDFRNKVKLLVRGSAMERCNEENQRKIKQMESEGLVEIWFNSAVKQIEPTHLMINRNGTEIKLSNDFLFIFAGAEMPQKFLMSLGIQIDKKFGEALKKTISG